MDKNCSCQHSPTRTYYVSRLCPSLYHILWLLKGFPAEHFSYNYLNHLRRHRFPCTSMLGQIRKLLIIIERKKKSAHRGQTVTVTELTQVSMCVHPDKPDPSGGNTKFLVRPLHKAAWKKTLASTDQHTICSIVEEKGASEPLQDVEPAVTLLAAGCVSSPL